MYVVKFEQLLHTLNILVPRENYFALVQLLPVGNNW